MIKRPLIILGLQGRMPDQALETSISMDKGHLLIPFGLVQRKENDYFKALDLALELKTPDRKLFIVEKTLSFDPQNPQLKWEDLAPDDFEQFSNGKIFCSAPIASAFGRYYQFTKEKDATFLTGFKKTDRAQRGWGTSPTPMVGREKELFELSEVLEQSFEDRGQVASIIGEGGLGKTLLWSKFEKKLEEEKVLHFQSGFTLHQSQMGLQNLMEQVINHFQPIIGLSQNEQSFLDHFLHPQQKQKIIEGLSQEDILKNIANALRVVLTQLQSEKMVWILDDMHWADEFSIQLIEELIPAVPTTHLMLLLIHRPTYKPSFSRELFYHAIPLKALEVNEIENQIKNILRLDYIAPSTLRKLHSHSKGNPFFIEEIVRHSLDRKLISAQTKIIENLPLDQGIPINIESMIQARLDQLNPNVFEALQWLCVLGSTFLYDEAMMILDKQNLDPSHTFEYLQKEKYIVEISAFPENRWGFYHDLIFENLRDQNINPTQLEAMDKSIALHLIEFYPNDQHKHIERICDHLLKVSFEPSFTPHFEQSAQKSFDQNQFQKVTIYLGHLFQYRSLTKNLYSTYAQSLINTNELNALEIFLNTWEKIATIETEDPETGFYRYYYQYLTIYRQYKKAITTIHTDIKKYKEKYKDDELHSLMEYYFESLSSLNQWSHLTNLIFSYLRNIQGTATHKIEPLYHLSHFTSDIVGSYNSLSLDFINKGIRILQSNPTLPLDKKNKIFKRYAFFQTVHQCNYPLSVKIWETLIELKNKHNIFSDLDTCYTQLIVNQFFSGQYKNALESFSKIDNITKYRRTRHYYYAGFWIALIHLITGQTDQFKKILLQMRVGRFSDAYLRIMRFYCMAHYHAFQSNYHKASISFLRMNRIYTKYNVGLLNSDTELLHLTAQIQYQNKMTTEQLEHCKKIFENKILPNSYNDWSAKMHALTLARFTDFDFGYNLKDIHPKDCPNALLKQKMYVEKIKLLDHQNRKSEANTLRKEFEAYRKQLSLHMPDDMKQSFLEKPLFPVP